MNGWYICPLIIFIMTDRSELEGRVMEKPILNTIRPVLAEQNVQDVQDVQSLAIEDKQKEYEDDFRFFVKCRHLLM